MTSRLAIALCQIAPEVGDVEGNVARILAARDEAGRLGADLAVFCELSVSGYPPEDLVSKPAFQAACRAAVGRLAQATANNGPAMIVGAPWREDAAVYNGAFLLDAGAIAGVARKRQLPNYGVFDEPRRFTPATGAPQPIAFRGVKLGLLICEDLWVPGVPEALAGAGAELLIAPHGSPFRASVAEERQTALRRAVRAAGLPALFLNQVSGQDETVFDGASFVMDKGGEIVFRAPQFETGVFSSAWRKSEYGWMCEEGPRAIWPEGEEKIYRAITLGLRDYARKNGFGAVVLGLSGGVDSALVAALAVDALGPAAVRTVMMPSRYTSTESLEDAALCARALGVSYETIAIEPAMDAFEAMLAPAFAGRAADTTEENIQARIRGVTLMALANKFSAMVLTTGNKSELAVGYATLYGDMNGGYNPLKDVYKTQVYRLCAWRNAHHGPGLLGPKGALIPERIIAKAPSAELRAGQRDEDSLPPYATLDAILERLVEQEQSVRDIVAAGFDAATTRKVARLLYLAEHKRRQSPPGPKVSPVNFGRDRRYPITNGWRDDG